MQAQPLPPTARAASFPAHRDLRPLSFEVDATPGASSLDRRSPTKQTHSRHIPMWHAQLSRSSFDAGYLAMRDEMADSAYSGRWSHVSNLLDVAETTFGESWVNCFRLRTFSSSPSNIAYLAMTRNLIDRTGPEWREDTGWTPLHQAAFMSAPVSVVRNLLERGAMFKSILPEETE